MQNGEKREYSNGLVMIVIFILALFIILPPAFRLLFPANDVDEVEQLSYLITCSKNASTTEGYFAESKTYYIKGKPTKNVIEFYALNTTQKREGDVPQEVTNPEIIDKTEQVVGEGNTPSTEPSTDTNTDTTTDTTVNPEGDDSLESGTEGEEVEVDDVIPTERTLAQEIAFFRTLESVGFNEAGTLVSVEINKESLYANADNTQLQNYLLNDMTQHELFYHELGYVCIKEEITGE